jgi:hypothetical protein
MDYSWIAVVKKSLGSINVLAQKLHDASTGESLSGSELGKVISDIEENTSRVSRLLSLERDYEIKEILPTFHISPEDLYVLTPDIDNEVRKAQRRA